MPDKPTIEPPYFPIIYVRGYAMTEREIVDTVSTPYMGFEMGATKIRQAWDGQVHRLIFESPLVRLMKDYGYRDIYRDGAELADELPAKSIVIHRYYEQADPDLGSGKVPSIEDAAAGLSDLILRVRDQVCGDDAEARKAFRVILVAHSMGGLVCRCFLQNATIGSAEAKALVDKVFTYATPHNGIDMAGMNVPSFFSPMDLNNFNRKNMADYLGLSGTPERVDTLDGKFDPDRFHCLVGTNSKDYAVAFGLSSVLSGEMSDGLVRMENASVQGAPRAFVHRSHSGYFGIVNSEEGYQNLTRFLFGDVRVDGVLDVNDLPLPPEVQEDHNDGKEVRASYYFEAAVAPRGALTYDLTRRTRANNSAILRGFDELLKPQAAGLDTPRSPYLFSVFLDTDRIPPKEGNTLVFTVDLAVSTTGYEITGRFWGATHIPGEYLFRDTLVLRATPGKTAQDWSVIYVWSDDKWATGRGQRATFEGGAFRIPVQSGKGFDAMLRLIPSRWR
jgi:hypothetical protein